MRYKARCNKDFSRVSIGAGCRSFSRKALLTFRADFPALRFRPNRLKEFGEDKEIDRLIRKYGYKTTPEILSAVSENEDLRNNLSAAAHLIHGSSENRFKITYCPGFLSKEEIEGVNFNYAPLDEMIKKYNPENLKNGYNTLENGEEIFYISNPATGLWKSKKS